MTKKAEAYWPLILLMAIIKFVLPLFLQSSAYELHRDEFLYYQQGQHLAFGFLENPPLISLLAAISSLFGGSEAWVKIWPCLAGAGTLIITCLITAQLGGRVFAQFLAGLAIMSGAFMRTNFLFQPVMLEVFAWTLALYFLVRYLTEKKNADIYGLTLSLALGWWSKYSVLFLVAAIIGALLLTRNRRIFVNKHFWFASCAALVAILPNILWQYQHNWPLVHHMKELRETQLQYVNPLEFFEDQFMLIVPAVFVWVIGLIDSFRRRQPLELAFVYVGVILLLVLGKGKSYYTLGLYPVLMGVGAATIERIIGRHRWIRYAVSIFIIAVNVLIISILLPTAPPAKLATYYNENAVGKTAGRKWEDQQLHALPQDFADMLGWKELSGKAERLFLSLPDTVRTETMIFCDNYGQAGALRFYGNNGSFRSRVISANGSFLLWMPQKLNFKHFIYIHTPEPDSDKRIFALFQNVSIKESVSNVFSRQLGNQVILMENIIPGGTDLFNGAMSEMRQRFSH